MTRPCQPHRPGRRRTPGRQDHPRVGTGNRAGDHRSRRGRRLVHAPPRPRLGPGPDDSLPARAEQGSAAGWRRRDCARPAQGRPRRHRLGWPAPRRSPRLPRAGAGPPARGAAAGHPASGHPARDAPPGHPAPARRRPGPAHPGRLQRPRRAAHLPGPVRLPARPCAQRAAELVDNPDETDDLLRLGLHRLPIGEFPLASLASVLAVYDGAAELERGLDILLTGLASTLPPPDGARPSSWAVQPASRPAPHRPDTKGVRKAGASPEPTEDLSAGLGRRRTRAAATSRPHRPAPQRSVH